MAVLTIFSVFLLICFVNGKNVHEMEIVGKDKHFSWDNLGKCGTNPITIKKFDLSPDPIKYGSELTMSLAIDVPRDIGTSPAKPVNIDMSLIMDYGSGQKVDLCEYEPELCHIKDVCKLLKEKKFNCPPMAKALGIDCQCPLKKKTYAVTGLKYRLPDPTVTVTGYVNATVIITEGGNRVMCDTVGVCLDNCVVP